MFLFYVCLQQDGIRQQQKDRKERKIYIYIDIYIERDIDR